MTQFLPPNLLALFSARPPIPFKPPVEGLKKRKNARPYIGVADFMDDFEDTPAPPATRGETRDEKERRREKEKMALQEAVLDEKLSEWDPHADPNAVGDPFKTLFVGRISFDTTETKLRRELESYGPVRRVYMVANARSGKPRGYAFVEYEHERDMYSAYKHADGKKINNRRIVVDVERGRTVKSWRPRRLGGGLGGTRRGGPDDNIRHSGRVEQWERERERDKDRDRRDKDRKRSRSRDRDRDRDREKRRDKDRDRSSTRRRDGDRHKDDARAGDSEKPPEPSENGAHPDIEIKQEPVDPGYEGVEKERPRDSERREKRDRDRDRDRDRRDRDSRRDRERGRERERVDRGKDRDREVDREATDERPPVVDDQLNYDPMAVLDAASGNLVPKTEEVDY